MHTEHKTWLPFIATGISVVILVIVFSVRSAEPSLAGSESDQIEANPVSAPVTERKYEGQVNSILEEYSLNQDAEAAHQALIDLRVPESYTSLHLQLVLAMNTAVQGDTVEANNKLKDLTQLYSWLDL